MLAVFRLIACFAAGAVLSAAAVAQNPPAADNTAAQIQAEAAAADLSASLKEALMKAIAAGGPVSGVEACHVQAPMIADEVGRLHGLSVGRIGTRVRNQENKARGWQGLALQDFGRRVAAGEAPELIRKIELSPDGATLRMARGIRTEGACLMCHGPSVPPEVEASIRSRYPEDRATGFAEGSLRGLLWVEVPVSVTATNDGDQRAAVTLSPQQATALRLEMRRQLEGLQTALGGLAVEDWDAVIRAGLPAVSGPGAETGPGSDFRRRLPPRWFQMSRPLQQSLRAAAEEAGGAKRSAVIVAHLADATAHCNACHVTFRIRETANPDAALESPDVAELMPMIHPAASSRP